MKYIILAFIILSYFFFQAEDGIRDADVTGVQTCALPISFLGCLKTEAQFSFLKRVQCDLFQGYLFSKAVDIDTLITKVTEQRYKFLPEQIRSEEHTSELQSRPHLVCRLLLEKKHTTSRGL